MTFRSSSNNLAVLTVLAAGVFTVGTDLFVLNGLLPTIATDLRVTESTAGQVFTVLLWVVQAAVWGLATLALAGYTGLVRKIT